MMFVAVVTTLAVSIAAPVGALGRWSFSRRPLPAIATTTTTTTTTTAPTQPSAQTWGMNAISLTDTPAQQDAQLADMADNLHVTSIRIDLDWRWVQYQSASTYDWSLYDQVVPELAAYHLSALFIIQGCADWACPGAVNAPANATQAEEFGQFAGMVAQRYGSEVPSAYEIWNEPNNTSFWAPSANPANYVAVLQDAYTAIKAVQPTQTVVSGGLAPEETSDGDMDAAQFLSDVYADGGGHYFNVVGDHPYSWPALPDDVESWSGWDELSYDSTSIRSVMVANGDAAKKVWLTEVGYPSNTTSVTGIAGPAAEADEVSQVAAFAAATSWIGGVWWYQYQDGGTDTSNVEDWFGVISASGAQKPAYAAMEEDS